MSQRKFTFADLQHMEAIQVSHPCMPRIRVKVGLDGDSYWILPEGMKPPAIRRSIEDIAQTYAQRDFRIKMAEKDPHNYAWVFPTWDENLWEICRLRVRNPGIPVHFLASGGQGTAKSWFAAWVLSKLIVQLRARDFLCLTINEPKSQGVQQKWLKYFLPPNMQNAKGKLGTTADQKMGFNPAEGFTSNKLAYRGNTVKFSFWSADITELDGQRPWTVFSDESVPLDWTLVVGDRLMTRAEGSKESIPKWQALLEKKKSEPWLEFPHPELGDLFQGVHLVTWTPAQGRTDTVDKFQSDGVVMEEIETDRDLLPRFDSEGKVIGGEIHPRLIYSKDPAYACRMMYPWENKVGGNWEGQKKKAIQARTGKTEILWKFYGITSKAGGTPFNNFHPQMHVIPRSWLPKIGTFYHIVDPTVSGQKTWTQIWGMVSGEHFGYIKPGDLIVVHEYPQCDDIIPGYGKPDEWATPGGDKGRGNPGNIQHGLTGGFQDKANEMARIEKKIGEWMGLSKPIAIPLGNRIMDSRAAETETKDKSESKTLIQWMEDCVPPVYFIPAGKASGAASGMTDISPGEQAINDLLSFDRDNCEIDKETGRMVISPLKSSVSPRLWIVDSCTNLIASVQNYPGIGSVGAMTSMWKDFIDPIRYWVISNPFHRAPVQQGDGEVGGW